MIWITLEGVSFSFEMRNINAMGEKLRYSAISSGAISSGAISSADISDGAKSGEGNRQRLHHGKRLRDLKEK
ncbi:MAG: hypothetical protein V3S64_14225 [bacterium]